MKEITVAAEKNIVVVNDVCSHARGQIVNCRPDQLETIQVLSKLIIADIGDWSVASCSANGRNADVIIGQDVWQRRILVCGGCDLNPQGFYMFIINSSSAKQR